VLDAIAIFAVVLIVASGQTVPPPAKPKAAKTAHISDTPGNASPPPAQNTSGQTAATPTKPPTTPPSTPNPSATLGKTALAPIPDLSGDYIPCRFTPAELQNLHAPQLSLTLSDADAESLKERVSTGVLAASESKQISQDLANEIITKVVADDFKSLTLSQALGRIIKIVSEAQKTVASQAPDKQGEDTHKIIDTAVKSDPKFSPAQAPALQQFLNKLDEVLPQTTEPTPEEHLRALQLFVQEADTAPQLKPFTSTVVKALGSSQQNNLNSVVDSARQFLARLERPTDVGCAMSILSPKETSKAYGYIIAHEYIAVQVVVRNLNSEQEFVLHDVEYAVNTDPTGTPGRFFSGRDKVIVRALSTAQESFDPRNIVISTAQGVGALFSAIAPLVGGSLVAASGVINGATIPWLQKAWKDQSVDQLNLLNDTGFSASISSQTRVPKSGTVVVVTFIPSKQFSQGWWVQPCTNYSYVGSRLANVWTGAAKLKFYSPDSDDQEVGRALQVCGAAGKDAAEINFDSKKHGSGPPHFLKLPASPALDIDSITPTPDKSSSTLTIQSLPTLPASAPVLARINTVVNGKNISDTYSVTIGSSGVTVASALPPCTAECGTITLLDETDIFRLAKTVNYWNWGGKSLQLFANLSLVVVAGTHVIDQSQLELSISDLSCPGADESGNVTFTKPLPPSITCTLTGKNLNKAAKLKLRNSKDAADTATVDGTVAVSGDSTNATVTFKGEDLRCLAQPAYSVFAVSSTGAEQSTKLTLHFSPSPYAASIDPKALDFSTGSKQPLAVNGCLLTSVASLKLTTKKGESATFDSTSAAATKATFSIDSANLSKFGSSETGVVLSVLDKSKKETPIDPTLDIGAVQAVPLLKGSVQITPPAKPNMDFTFKVTGSNFDAKSALVTITGTGCTADACTIENGKLKITATDISGTTKLPAGTYKLTVQNGASGTKSNELSFDVKASPAATTPAVPSLKGTVQITPPAKPNMDFTFKVTGSNFDAKSALATITGTGCTADACTIENGKLKITATDVSGTTKLPAGTYKLTVQNGASGKKSNALSFDIKASPAAPVAAAPTLKGSVQITPPPKPNVNFTFKVSGSNFNTKTTLVTITGAGCTSEACTIENGKLKITATDVSGTTKLPAGSYKLTVQNGASGKKSNTIAFDIQ